MPKGKGTYGNQVGRPSEEDKPFKMSGHTLPGPNQRSALKWSEASTSESIMLAGSSQKKYDEWKLGGQTPVGSSIEGNEHSQELQPQETQAYVDTGMDDSGIDTTAAGDDTAKKKVDVEVTVNDKKI